MDHAALIAHYGYVATFVGTLVEGESLLILSGLAAHRGYLSFPWIVLVGALGGALGDVGFFLLGRHHGPRLLERFPRFAPAATRLDAMIERHAAFAIVAVRFMYGMRTAGPAIIGTTRVRFAEFVLLNAVGALVWSACWVAAGWLFGTAAERLLASFAHTERDLFGAAAIAVAAIALVLHVRRARAQRRLPPGESAGE